MKGDRMTEEELSKIVEARLADRLAARLAADRERVRQEVIMELRREIDREHYDRINARHPIQDKYAGLTREQHEERLRIMSERAAQANREMDEANARVVDGSLKAQRAAKAGGSAGFRIK
jgi:hypothetical protein